MMTFLLSFVATVPSQNVSTLPPERVAAVRQLVENLNEMFRITDPGVREAFPVWAMPDEGPAASSIDPRGYLTFSNVSYTLTSSAWEANLDRRGYIRSIRRKGNVGTVAGYEDGGASRIAGAIFGTEFELRQLRDETIGSRRKIVLECSKRGWRAGLISINFDQSGFFESVSSAEPHVIEGPEVAAATPIPSDSTVQTWVSALRTKHKWNDEYKLTYQRFNLFPRFMNLDPKRSLPAELRNRLIEGKAVPTVNIILNKKTQPAEEVWLALDARDGRVLTLFDSKTWMSD